MTTMTRYSSDLDTPDRLRRAGRPGHDRQVLAEHGVRQLHVAETEKYAHVTYFFNGGREEAWPGETRTARAEPARRAELRLQAGDVGGRGRGPRSCDADRRTATASASSTSRTPTWSATPASIPAVVEAVETADRCLGRVVERVTELGGVCLVTADHGNAEQMLEADGVSPHTAHTTNPVPLIVTVARRDARARAASSPISLRQPCNCWESSRRS